MRQLAQFVRAWPALRHEEFLLHGELVLKVEVLSLATHHAPLVGHALLHLSVFHHDVVHVDGEATLTWNAGAHSHAELAARVLAKALRLEHVGHLLLHLWVELALLLAT